MCSTMALAATSRFEYPNIATTRTMADFQPAGASTQMVCLSYGQPVSVMPVLSTIFKSCQVAIHEPSRCIVLRGAASDVSDAAQWLSQVDRPVGVIALDVQILEVFSENAEDHDHLLKQLADQASLTYSPVTGGLASKGGLTVFLKALTTQGKARLLAKPQVVTLHGQQASLHVGDRVPYATTVSTAQSTSTKIDFLETGISLVLTPTVVTANRIQAEVSAEFISAKWTAETMGVAVPVLSTRQTKTVVQLTEGQPLTIAGLIHTQDKTLDEKITGLADLPLIGPLFSAARRQYAQSDVVFIITPRILK
jgi:type II secretory pathway component GspD/PulD (secretin)